MNKSKIEWTDATWNPVTGCTKISTGCKNCYAERITKRFGGDFSKIIIHPERLVQPYRYRKSKKIFVNSMSDLFHEDIHSNFIRIVFRTMDDLKEHTFQVLTKRPERMQKFINENYEKTPKNIWLGVSVENQAQAENRIIPLLDTPASVRFLSCEPLLENIDLGEYLGHNGAEIKWVIVGGESGAYARYMNSNWARDILTQCRSFNIAFFMKQMSRRNTIPVDLMVREFPKVQS